MTTPADDPASERAERSERAELADEHPERADEAAPAGVDPDADDGRLEPRGRPGWRMPGWAQLVLLVAAIGVIIAFVLLPRASEPDPWEDFGEEGSAARQVADLLDDQLTCTSGPLSDERSVLACYGRDSERVTIVFLQADPAGRVAGYTAETLPIGGTPDTGQATALGNQIAAIVTPGEDFTACSHDRANAYFCFGSLATWESPDLPPVQNTGEKDRLPAIPQLDGAFGEAGWECSYGICTKGTTMLTVQQPLTGLGISYAAPFTGSDVRETAAGLIELIDGDKEQLQEWVQTLDDQVSITVADRFVAGYVPQPGGGGLFVIDEVAGVMPDVA